MTRWLGTFGLILSFVGVVSQGTTSAPGQSIGDVYDGRDVPPQMV